MGDDTDSTDDENINYLIAASLFPCLQATERRAHAGSVLGKRPNADRQFEAAYQRLLHDYVRNAKYSNSSFERRFRMPRAVFDRLLSAVDGCGIFTLRKDATGSAQGLGYWRRSYLPFAINSRSPT